MAWETSSSGRQYERTMPLWEAAMQAWDRLFYCSRCAHVFDPGTSQFVPAHQMFQLLKNDDYGNS